jgi:hypothetical protein
VGADFADLAAGFTDFADLAAGFTDFAAGFADFAAGFADFAAGFADFAAGLAGALRFGAIAPLLGDLVLDLVFADFRLAIEEQATPVHGSSGANTRVSKLVISRVRCAGSSS